MTATWPAALPQTIPADGFTSDEGDNVLRTEMDLGPPKRRRRTTAAIVAFSCTLKLTSTQRTTLRTFYITTLADGSLAFTWTHPHTGASCQMAFTGPITWTWSSGSWYAVLPLVVVP